MYFLYFLILCYPSTLLIPVNSYVVLAANLNDFRSIAKKFVPTDLVNQIKALVLENGPKYSREPSKHDEQVDRSVDYEEISKHDENSYEFAEELKAALEKQLNNGYQLKRSPTVAFVETIRSPQVTQVAAPSAPVLTLNDVVKKVKDNVLKEFFENGHALGNTLADNPMQSVSSQVYNNVINKYAAPVKAKGQMKKPVYNPVPMKVLKEEVHFEASYEDTDNKPHMQYYNEYYKPIQNKSPANNNNYPYIYAKNTIPQKNKYDGSKKVRFVKQVLVPAPSNQGQSLHVSQSNFVQQPRLGHQSNIVQHSNSEPHLSWHQGSTVQQPLHQTHINIAQQLALMQQQIDQLTKIAQDHGFKKKTALESPHLNIEAIDAHFHILPHESVRDKNKTNDSQKDQDKPTEDTTVEPAFTKNSTKDFVPRVVENEQFADEADSANSIKNKEEATENKPEENEEEVTENKPEENEDEATENKPEENEEDATENKPEENEEEATENKPEENEEEATENKPEENEEEAIENKPEEITETNLAEDENAEADVSTIHEVKVDNNARAGSETKVHTQEFGNRNAGEPIVEKTYNFETPTKEADVPPLNINIPVSSARKVMLF